LGISQIPRVFSRNLKAFLVQNSQKLGKELNSPEKKQWPEKLPPLFEINVPKSLPLLLGNFETVKGTL